MKTLQATTRQTRISIQIIAADDDGSLQHLLDAIFILVSQILAWIELQLDIAAVAEEFIIEARLLMRQANIALGLLIEVLGAMLGVVHWLEDWAGAIGETWREVVGMFTIKWGYLPG